VPESSYLYSQGNLLDERNTYFYTRFVGAEFLEAFRRDRQQALADLPAPAQPPAASPQNPAATHGLTAELLEVALAASQQATLTSELPECFLKRFEVTKRVHSAYDEQFRPVDKQAFRDLTLYIRLGEVFESCCSQTGDLRFLNVLLKVIDVLVAHRHTFPNAIGARLAWLLEREAKHLDDLRITLEVAA